jgi:hypothetical protein
VPTSEIVDQDARKLVKALYEATDGSSMEWRMIIGRSARQAAAVDHAVEKGWILVEEGRNLCLTDEGAALARTTLS